MGNFIKSAIIANLPIFLVFVSSFDLLFLPHLLQEVRACSPEGTFAGSATVTLLVCTYLLNIVLFLSLRYLPWRQNTVSCKLHLPRREQICPCCCCLHCPCGLSKIPTTEGGVHPRCLFCCIRIFCKSK